MKPLIWGVPKDFKNRHVMNYNWRDMAERTNTTIFRQGKHLPCADIGQIPCSLDPKNYDLIFASESPPEEFTEFDCLPNNGQAPLVNKKVLDILTKLCPKDIQAFPAIIAPETGSSYAFENHDYWVINITKLVDAIDKEKTEFLYLSKSLGGDVYGAKRLALKSKSTSTSTSTSTYLLARDKTLKTTLVVDQLLVQAFKEAKISGVEFIEDKDY